MKLTDDYSMSRVVWDAGLSVQTPEEQAAQAGALLNYEDPAVLLDLSFDALKFLDFPINERDGSAKNKLFNMEFPDAKTENKGNGIEDSSGRLTKMLVAARSREEVQYIISKAYTNMGEALKAAAGGDEKAMDIVKRLNRLIRRANRKIRDLTKENDVRQKQKRAEKKELEQLSRQLKDELKRKIAERKQREKRYLFDTKQASNKKQYPITNFSIAALEAQMRMLEFAQKMAHTSIAPVAIHAEISGGTATSGGDADVNEE